MTHHFWHKHDSVADYLRVRGWHQKAHGRPFAEKPAPPEQVHPLPKPTPTNALRYRLGQWRGATISPAARPGEVPCGWCKEHLAFWAVFKRRNTHRWNAVICEDCKNWLTA